VRRVILDLVVGERGWIRIANPCLLSISHGSTFAVNASFLKIACTWGNGMRSGNPDERRSAGLGARLGNQAVMYRDRLGLYTAPLARR
jgi:hypothetical protein